jgi:nucleoside-diphosphate-sugar epimerase
MKIALTGGSGFIGTKLRKELEAQGNTCVNIDLKEANDILDLLKLTTLMQGCDCVYHLAAEHRDDVFPRSRYYDVNVQGMKNVLAAMDANNIGHIIFTSSFAVYGLDAQTPDETSKPAPFNDYGQSKLEGEEVLMAWAAKNEKANAIIVRPVVVFGEKNRGNVYTLVNQLAQNKFLMIGDGSNKKSIAYVGNVTAFLRHCLNDQSALEIYNYADGPDFTMKQLMNVICDKLGKPKPAFSLPYAAGLGAGYMFDGLARITGKNFPISAVRIRKFCADTTSSADKARRSGFNPPFTLEEGIERMINHDFAQVKKAA